VARQVVEELSFDHDGGSAERFETLEFEIVEIVAEYDHMTPG